LAEGALQYASEHDTVPGVGGKLKQVQNVVGKNLDRVFFQYFFRTFFDFFSAQFFLGASRQNQKNIP